MYLFIRLLTPLLFFVLLSNLVSASENKLSAGSYNTCVIDDTGVNCWGSNSYSLLRIPTLVNPKVISVGSISACAIDDVDISCWGYSISGQPSFNNPKNISVGSRYACAIDDDGIKCWGSNSDGQTTVPSLTNPTAISAGTNHACAIADEGVKCWGNDSYGKTTVPSLTNPKSVSSGNNNTCAIDDDGVKCWGYNGNGINEVPTLNNPIIISSGNRHACAIDNDGIKCWGTDTNDMLNVPSLINPKLMSVGSNHTCAMDDEGVKCWGLNRDGQGTVLDGLLFDVDSDNDGVLDVIDIFPDDANETIDTDNDGIGNNADADDDNDGVLDIHDLLPLNKWFAKDFDNDGIPDKWEEKFNLDPQNPSDKNTDLDDDGLTAFEEFAYQTNPNHTDSDKDTLPDGWEVLNGRDPSKSDYDISTIGGVNCAIDDDGAVCWGREWSGDNRIKGLLNPFSVSVGGNGDVICFLDDIGASCKYKNSYQLIRLPFLNNPREIGAGYASCAIDDDGVKCWKDPNASWPELAHPEVNSIKNKDFFSVPDLLGPFNLSVGRNHACVIDNEDVKCWLTWKNDPNDQNEQHIVPELINPKVVAAGMWSTCAIDDEGIKCWGLNNKRQAEPPKLSNPREISGGLHYCAVDDDGISCWGRNTNGEINVPVVKQSTRVSAGTDGNWWGSSCSLGMDGIVCWGKSPSFEIQNNNFDDVKLYIDPDGDGFSNQYGKDTFPLDPFEWLDTDYDGVGNNTDIDDDNDEVPDNIDAFPLNSKEWADSDGDTVGDNTDVFPNDASETIDTDADDIGDNSDNCLNIANTEQLDTDSDGLGNACDNDDDNDGVFDSVDQFPLDISEQADTDNDGLGDNYEIINGLDRKSPDFDSDGLKDGEEVALGTNPKIADSDDDGVIDGIDKFPLISIGSFLDSDNDGAPDECNEACLALGMKADKDGIAPYILLEQPTPQFASLTPTAKIIVTSAEGENFFDVAKYIPSGTADNPVSVVGETFLISGSSDIDGFMVQPGVKYDLTNLKGGIDKLYFSGPLAEYADSILLDSATGIMQVSRLTDVGEEIVQFIATASAADTLIFTDGALSTADVKTAVSAQTPLTDLTLDTTIKALDDKTITGATVKHIVLNSDGGSVMGLGPSIKTLISGNSGIDQIYVPAGSVVDASNLKSGRDEIIVEGNLADYDIALDTSGNIVLSRDVVIDDIAHTEEVTVANGGNVATNDLVIFADQQLDTSSIKKQL